MEITAINIQGTVRRISSSTMTMSTYNSVIPYLLWERVPENSWIVCPRYGKKPYDIQLAITGTCWYNELTEKALTREIQEESGLVLTSAPDLLYQTTRGPKNWLWGICNADNCRASRGVQNFTPGGKDDRSRKVGAIVYSTRHGDLVNMIRNAAANGGLSLLPHDNIIELLLIPRDMVVALALPTRKPKVTVVDEVTKNMNLLTSIVPKTKADAAWPRRMKTAINQLLYLTRGVISKKKKSGTKISRKPRKLL
jgi:ADP-ribose pyrophosphatase YjhB (NUDIX family)